MRSQSQDLGIRVWTYLSLVWEIHSTPYILFYFYFVLYYVYVYRFVHLSTLRTEGRRQCQIPLVLELQAILSHLLWVLGTKLAPSGRLESTLNC